jgi:hypothetical protein
VELGDDGEARPFDTPRTGGCPSPAVTVPGTSVRPTASADGSCGVAACAG